MSYQSSKYYEKIINSGILISGVPRSGTSLISQIISTTGNFEFNFDPFFLNTINLNDKKNPKITKLMLEQYLVDDFFYDSFSYRRINLNMGEKSYSFNFKTKKYKNKLFSKEIFFKNYKRRKLLIKIVGLSNTILLQKYFKIKTVLILRNPHDVIKSIIKKNWFTNNSFKSGKFPLFFEKNNFKFPVWIENENRMKWKNYSYPNRVAFYVYDELKKILKTDFNIAISFENFLENPSFEIDKLRKITKVKYNKQFLKLKKKIKKTKKTYKKILIEKDLELKINTLYKKIKIKYKL